MKRVVTIICTVLLAFGLAAGPFSAAPAAPSDADISAAAKKLGEMEAQMAAVQQSYQIASEKLAKARADAAASRQELSKLNTHIEANRKELSVQANYLYRAGNASFLEAVFSSQSFGEAFGKITMLGQVSDSNAQLLSDLRKNLRQRTTAQMTLDTALQQQEAQTAALKQQSDQIAEDIATQQAYVNKLTVQQQQALDAARLAANSQPHAFAPTPPNPPADGTYVAAGPVLTGEASWYNTGTTTANGEHFDPSAMTAAHKTLRFGTLLRVTYQGRSVVVRINDRGPYAGNRVLDLSQGAARVIGLEGPGHGIVTYQIVVQQ